MNRLGHNMLHRIVKSRSRRGDETNPMDLRTPLPPPGRMARPRLAVVVAVCASLLALTAAAPRAHAGQPFIWDDDGDGLDDRMETVRLLGYQFSFEGAD